MCCNPHALRTLCVQCALQYDQDIRMFSPKGNLHQADYALRAVNRAKPSIGIKTNEGSSLIVHLRLESA
jgi:20S proteasome alpha/beta subunit